MLPSIKDSDDELIDAAPIKKSVSGLVAEACVYEFVSLAIPSK